MESLAGVDVVNVVDGMVGGVVGEVEVGAGSGAAAAAVVVAEQTQSYSCLRRLSASLPPPKEVLGHSIGRNIYRPGI